MAIRGAGRGGKASPYIARSWDRSARGESLHCSDWGQRSGWLADDLHRSASSIGGVGRRCDADDEARDRLEAKVLGSEVRSEQRCVASLR